MSKINYKYRLTKSLKIICNVCDTPFEWKNGWYVERKGNVCSEKCAYKLIDTR